MIDYLQSLRLVGLARKGLFWTLLEYAVVWAGVAVFLFLFLEANHEN